VRTYHSLLEVADPPAAGRVVAIGVFDGVHRGHQEILLRAVEAARATGASAAAVTFYPHPDAVLHQRSAPAMLTPLPRKEELLEELGLDELVVVPFDRDFALLTPGSFCGAVLSDHLGARAVFVGENFRFGHGGVGTPDDLRQYGGSHGFEVVAVSLAKEGGEVISSTRIRECLKAGHVAEAARLLGRPHRIEGTVVSGAGRGRGLDAPTANLDPTPDMALPRQGIYITASTVNATESHRSVTSIGTNPTFNSDGKVRIETLLLDYSGTLYGAHLAVDFLERIRGQKGFPDAGTLAAQIRRDVETARTYFSRHAGGPEEAVETGEEAVEPIEETVETSEDPAK
jgi:riboflavin kinase / FMN adenylyltransferase